MTASEEQKRDSIGCLLVENARMLRKVFDRRMDSLGVTRSQWQVLVNLINHEGLSQSELAERIEIEQPSLVRLLNRLESIGLIERRVDERDRRVKRIYLGASSAPIMDEIDMQRYKLREEFLHNVSDDEREQITNLLARMKANLYTIQEHQR